MLQGQHAPPPPPHTHSLHWAVLIVTYFVVNSLFSLYNTVRKTEPKIYPHYPNISTTKLLCLKNTIIGLFLCCPIMCLYVLSSIL